MAKFTLTLEDISGAKQRLLYDTASSCLTGEDGARVPLDRTGYTYHDDVSFPAIRRISPENPGTKSRRVSRLKIQLGLGCNYSCSYCSQAAHKHEAEATGTADLPAFLAMLGAIEGAPERVELWGGEPLLYWKKIVVLVPALRERWPQARLGMVTNGVLLDDAKIDFIKAHDIKVTISHDGPGQAARGADPFEDPEWVRVVRRLFDEHGVWFNMVMSAANIDPAAAIRWLRERLQREVGVNKEGIVHAHQSGQALPEAALPKVTHTVFMQMITGQLHGVPYLDHKLENFYASLAFGTPTHAVGQKCQMDRDDHLAVDLAGNVITCQNTGAAGVHRIGHLEAIDDVALDTSLHWSHRPGCSTCPVLHFCHGACMFLAGPEFAATCRNEYAYNLGVFMAALYFLTGKVLVDLQPLEAERKTRRVIPIKEAQHGRNIRL